MYHVWEIDSESAFFRVEYQTEVINKTALYTVDKQQKYPANRLLRCMLQKNSTSQEWMSEILKWTQMFAKWLPEKESNRIENVLTMYNKSDLSKPNLELLTELSRYGVDKVYIKPNRTYFGNNRPSLDASLQCCPHDFLFFIWRNHWATEWRVPIILCKPMTKFHDNPSLRMEGQICGTVELPRSHAGDSPASFGLSIWLSCSLPFPALDLAFSLTPCILAREVYIANDDVG